MNELTASEYVDALTRWFSVKFEKKSNSLPEFVLFDSKHEELEDGAWVISTKEIWYYGTESWIDILQKAQSDEKLPRYLTNFNAYTNQIHSESVALRENPVW